MVQNEEISPDQARMHLLLDLPIPHSQKALKNCLGLFAYYAQKVPNYTDKAFPLIKASTFPLSPAAIKAFKEIRDLTCDPLTRRSLFRWRPIPQTATLNQEERPVAFFSWTFHGSEHCRQHRTDLLVEAMVRHASPHYTYVVFEDGREESVTTRDLTSAGDVGGAEELQTPTDWQDGTADDAGAPQVSEDQQEGTTVDAGGPQTPMVQHEERQMSTSPWVESTAPMHHTCTQGKDLQALALPPSPTRPPEGPEERGNHVKYWTYEQMQGLDISQKANFFTAVSFAFNSDRSRKTLDS
ncbi:uncharacterized protein [Narcine bancroftii]|uniref:uncharacterized protein n=1 Tax=Narcine bancroftii TaxID=1343680 RepID=UPI00383210D1